MPDNSEQPSRLSRVLERWLWPGQNALNNVRGVSNRPEEQHRTFLHDLDHSGFNFRVFLVASTGFFTDSYNLFASNVILPALGYVYWYSQADTQTPLLFDIATLAASAVGQVFFGWLADLYGRKALYGIELIIVVIGTIGMLQSSPGYSNGYHSTWQFTGWIIAWRVVMGLGIGAEYPLSASIASEWSSTKWRGRMMSSVFLMQPLGQLCANLAGLTALHLFGTDKVEIDKLWRYVVGFGAAPPLVALAFRISMPESGRYTFDVLLPSMRTDSSNGSVENGNEPSETPEHVPWTRNPKKSQFSFEELKNYLYCEGHWRYLLGTSVCWFLLDFAFYGMGFNSPSTLAKLWSNETLSFPPEASWWINTSSVANVPSSPFGPIVNGTWSNGTIADQGLVHPILRTNILHAIYTVSIPSILGSALMIYLIDYIDRKTFLTTTFVCIGVLLIVLFASFSSLFEKNPQYIVLIVFWMLISLLYSLGPNTLTFIIPAEIFPTRYRCTFYGIAAASGKIGALLVQVVRFADPRIGAPDSAIPFHWLLLGFAICMVLGGIFSCLTLPHVQQRKTDTAPPLENTPLESLPHPRFRQTTESQDHELNGIYTEGSDRFNAADMT